MTRIDIIDALRGPLERKVWTFMADIAHGAIVVALEQMQEQTRPSTRHRNWTVDRRIRFITTHRDARSTGQRLTEWSRWADVTRFTDNRWYATHDDILPAIEPPLIPQHVAQALAEKLKPTITLPSNKPKPETTT